MANCNTNPVTGKFEERTECTPLQLQMIAELITGISKTEACDKLGVPRATLYKWIGKEYFEKEYRKACEKMYKIYLNDAIKGIVEVATEGSGRDKVKACETLLKLNSYLDTKMDITQNTTENIVISLVSDDNDDDVEQE